jgi:hypothetical protein
VWRLGTSKHGESLQISKEMFDWRSEPRMGGIEQPLVILQQLPGRLLIGRPNSWLSPDIPLITQQLHLFREFAVNGLIPNPFVIHTPLYTCTQHSIAKHCTAHHDSTEGDIRSQAALSQKAGKLTYIERA